MMKPFTLLLMCILCASCINKGEHSNVLPDTKIIKVDFRKEYTERKFPHISHSLTVQKLEENDQFSVGSIDKVIIDDKRIYILDRSKAKSLFIYTRDGRLLHVINRIGGGPGYFTTPQDFDIEKKTGNIIIMDASSRKFIYYSPKGEFIKETKYDAFAVHFLQDGAGNFIIDKGNLPIADSFYCLKKIDQKGNAISDFFPADTTKIGITFTPRMPLQKQDDRIFFLPAMDNCIYELNGEEPHLAYQIDFGGDWPSKAFCESVKRLHPLKIRNMVMENHYACFLNYLQTKEVLHIDFHKDKKNYSFYYNKETGQSLLVPMEDENMTLPLTTYNNQFVFAKYSDQTGEPVLLFYDVNFNL